ncbi:DDE_Tnp_IS1595 domain-containing protein [Trichonephila inaurata madagascariensis]|uniref:DDE_Tnp_IS1595 domain-containing protein n=1 Tax=Trichonephila inaurata madagascariensis TaxID=2747483 RepID=A0A8X6IIE4_9ARAC|nr:DDE_Tnp_IS1595 domain-containing protein [Trichonephila inaurata madagascariensis]
MTSVEWSEKELNMNHITVVDWNYSREVCVKALAEREGKKISGPEKIVEIDESIFTKRKNNASRILWIFGGIYRKTDKCFLLKIPNHSLPVLLDTITNHIKERLIVHSDSWKGYCTTKMEEAAIRHFKVNHTYNFFDPNTGVNTQKIELGGSAK